jgi:tetratricopeptide (TPR) repeat protein
MNPAPPTPAGPENAGGSFKTKLRAFGRAVLAEGRRIAAWFAASARIALLSFFHRPRARYRLGLKCYEGGLFRDLFADDFAAIDRLKAEASAPPSEATEAPGADTNPRLQRLRAAASAALFKTRAALLPLRLRPLFAKLGGSVSQHPAADLRTEQRRLTAIERAIAIAKMRRARIATGDTGLLTQAASLWRWFCAGAVRLRIRTSALADDWSRRWQIRVAGTKLERLRRKHVIIGGLGVLIAPFALWACIEFWPINENDPQAVGRQADRLAAHPGDATKPAGVSGVSDEKLMSSWRNERALNICMKAVDFFPEDPRYLFELGRVLLLAGDEEDARDFLTDAAQQGHAGAKAYLGRLEPDPEKALAIFRQAAAAGFAPAGPMASEMEAYIGRAFAEAGQKADALAADPDDPSKPRTVKGVPDAALSSEAALEQAIDACSQAVAAYPDEPRYHYELGRVLLLAGAEEAVEQLEIAAEKEQGAALALLAQQQDDAFDAFAYLQRAVKAGYPPAKRMLAALEAKVGPDFEGDGYHFGGILRAFYDRDHDFLNDERWQNLHYADLINAALKTAGNDLHDPTMAENVARQLDALKRESARPISGQDIANALMFNNTRSPLSRPSLTSPEADARANVEKDVARLLSTYGKNGLVLKHLADDLKAFVR